MQKKPENGSASPAGYLVECHQKDYAAPKGFVSRAERQRREEARQAKERQAAEERRRKQQEEAREQAERQAIDAYWESLTPSSRPSWTTPPMPRPTPEERMARWPASSRAATAAGTSGQADKPRANCRRRGIARPAPQTALTASLRSSTAFPLPNRRIASQGHLPANPLCIATIPILHASGIPLRGRAFRRSLTARSPGTATALRARLQSLMPVGDGRLPRQTSMFVMATAYPSPEGGRFAPPVICFCSDRPQTNSGGRFGKRD